MPKVIDHDQRRREIVAVVWRLIATQGISALTMRTIAAEAGYANGVLSYYFANKDEVLQVAYVHVIEATNRRVAASIDDARGLVGLRALCREILPMTEDALLEARIAATLWQRAMHDAVMNRVNSQAWARWRAAIVVFLQQAFVDGEIGELDPQLTADAVLAALMGMQVLAVLTPAAMPADRQWAVLDEQLQRHADRRC